MRNMTYLLQAVALSGAIVVAGALAPMAAAQTASPLSAEKVQAKEAAVADHAARKKACKTQAKEQGLHLMKRKDFVRDCMAK